MADFDFKKIALHMLGNEERIAQRITDWLRTKPRPRAVNAFTAGPERNIAYAVEMELYTEAAAMYDKAYEFGKSYGLTALKPGDVLPNGLVVVPAEPSQAMLDEASEAKADFYLEWSGEGTMDRNICYEDEQTRKAWQAMLATAAEPGEKA